MAAISNNESLRKLKINPQKDHLNKLQVQQKSQHYGELLEDDGVIYEGHLDPTHRIKHGYGILKNTEGTVTFEGWFANDVKQGKGCETFLDGSRYEGDYKNGLKDGFGTYEFGDGTKLYEGHFKMDYMCGQGQMSYPDRFFKGTFWNNTKHGPGKEIYKNGKLKEGEWVSGKFTGVTVRQNLQNN